MPTPTPLLLNLHHLRPNQLPLKVNRIAQIHLAIVNKIMPAHKGLNRLLHEFDVEAVLDEEVFVGTLLATVAGVELGGHGLAGQDADVLGQDAV